MLRINVNKEELRMLLAGLEAYFNLLDNEFDRLDVGYAEINNYLDKVEEEINIIRPLAKRLREKYNGSKN